MRARAVAWLFVILFPAFVVPAAGAGPAYLVEDFDKINDARSDVYEVREFTAVNNLSVREAYPRSVDNWAGGIAGLAGVVRIENVSWANHGGSDLMFFPLESGYVMETWYRDGLGDSSKARKTNFSITYVNSSGGDLMTLLGECEIEGGINSNWSVSAVDAGGETIHESVEAFFVADSQLYDDPFTFTYYETLEFWNLNFVFSVDGSSTDFDASDIGGAYGYACTTTNDGEIYMDWVGASAEPVGEFPEGTTEQLPAEPKVWWQFVLFAAAFAVVSAGILWLRSPPQEACIVEGGEEPTTAQRIRCGDVIRVEGKPPE